MGRVVLSICERCEHSRSSSGQRLFDTVKQQRRERALKELFKVELVSCLKCCDRPCAIEFSGKKRSTYTRVEVRISDATQVVDAAVLYANLQPGEELSERVLPGECE
jgi:predicted metal-binding protein